MVSILGVKKDQSTLKKQKFCYFKIDETLDELMDRIYNHVDITKLPYKNGFCEKELWGFKLIFSESPSRSIRAFCYLHSMDSSEFHLFNCRFAGQVLAICGKDKKDKIICRDISRTSKIEIKPLGLKIELDDRSGGVFIERPGKVPKGFENCFYPSRGKTESFRYSNLKKECFGMSWYWKHKEECQNDINLDIMYLSASSAHAPYDNREIDKHTKQSGWDFLPEEVRKSLTISWSDIENTAISWIKANIIPSFD